MSERREPGHVAGDLDGQVAIVTGGCSGTRRFEAGRVIDIGFGEGPLTRQIASAARASWCAGKMC